MANDPRRAAYTVLPNGLRVLLVSDPAGQRAGAAVDVAVGSLDDPEGRQGLAHFLEHMLASADCHPAGSGGDPQQNREIVLKLGHRVGGGGAGACSVKCLVYSHLLSWAKLSADNFSGRGKLLSF